MQNTRHHPETSKMAYESQKEKGNIQSIKDKIMSAMERIKYGHRDKIVEETGLTDAQVWRRLSDLANDGHLIRSDYSVRSSKSKERQSVYFIPGSAIELGLSN